MNQVTQEQKEATTKWLAIAGFIAIAALIVFLVVKLVSFLPSAWSSLASIADSVYNYDRNPTLVVTTKSDVVNSGDGFTLNWKEQHPRGSFEFSYSCTEGAAVEVRHSDGTIEPLACDTPLNLGTATALEVAVSTEKQRFTDLSYKLRFVPSDPRLEAMETNSRITIVNVRIPTSGLATDDQATTPEETIKPDETPVVTPKPTATSTPTKPKPQYVTNVTYSVPKSDPNGYTDLQVTFLGVGTLRGSTFILTPSLSRNESGAIRFVVKNIGTKTSNDWHYVANLPSDVSYTSKDQAPLKPQEEAIITVSFLGADRVGLEKFAVTAETTSDRNNQNNSFTWAVNVK